MKRIKIFSRHNVSDLLPFLKENFSLVEENPEVVLVWGGDGSLLQAEYLFPGIPKLLLKGSRVCKLCSSFLNQKFSNLEILQKFKDGFFTLEEVEKLEAFSKDHRLVALNDIVVHNSDVRHPLRYLIFINDQPYAEGREIIGDGIVASTPLGSTGYYRSITDSFFEVGLGLAFNNSTEQSDHVVLKEDSVIRMKITRGPAVVYADNIPESFVLENEEEITIQKSQQKAKIIKVI